jgi:hypothetical protein
MQQKESAISEAPVKSYMQMVEMHDEISAVESSNDPMLIDRPAPEATLPRPAATGTIRARRPCYGWISESESDSDYEEYLASRQHEVAWWDAKWSPFHWWCFWSVIFLGDLWLDASSQIALISQ